MLRGLAIAVALAGCSSVFGLEPPVRGDDAAVDDAPQDGPIVDARLVDAAPDSPPPATCPNGYMTILGLPSKYRRGTQNSPWATAQQLCAADQVPNSSLHTHLAVITTDAEASNVELFIAGDTWIGLSDRVTEGTYQWVTAEPTTYPPASGGPWGTNQPEAGTTLDCVTASQAADFRVLDCGNNRDYLCECDAYAADPSRY